MSTPKKPIVKKTPAKKVKTVKQTPEKEPEFHLVISLNDKVFEFDTDDLRESIMSVEPEFLRTKVILKVTKDGKTLDRLYFLQQGKKLFYNKYFMDTLINNLIF